MEKQDFIPIILFLIFFGMNLLGYLFFPYEVVKEAIVDNTSNYIISQTISLISIIPICLFFVTLGYIAGVAKTEKSIEKI